MSGHFWEGLSQKAQVHTRKVDAVRQQSGVIFALHTYDIDLKANYSHGKNLHPDYHHPGEKGQSSRSFIKSLHRGMEEVAPELAEARLREEPYPAPNVLTEPYYEDIWNQDPDLAMLKNKLGSARQGPELLPAWEKAIVAYINGDWPTAIDRVTDFQNRYVDRNGIRDGPSDFLLDFMKSFDNCTAPEGWKGYHDA